MHFDNFILRAFKADDSENFFKLIDSNRDRLTRYFPITVTATKNLTETGKYVAERMFLAERKEFITFLIVTAENNIIGQIFLKNIDWTIPKCEIGFFIDKHYEGKGIITNGLKKVIDHSFDVLKINKLFMRVGEDNPGSGRVAEKCGFLLEGKLRNDFKTLNGELLDVFYYGLIP